jgi:hypothetical protein
MRRMSTIGKRYIMDFTLAASIMVGLIVRFPTQSWKKWRGIDERGRKVFAFSHHQCMESKEMLD